VKRSIRGALQILQPWSGLNAKPRKIHLTCAVAITAESAVFERLAEPLLAADELACGLPHVFRLANRVALRSASTGSRQQHSSIHCASASSDARYASVASRTMRGAASPMRCHSRQPWIAHWRMPAHSGLSFSNRSLSRFSGGRDGERDQVEAPPDGLIDTA
jgi:hypothetical protein